MIGSIDTGTVVLHYADHGDGGRPVLLLHELGGSSESWAAALPRFQSVVGVDDQHRGAVRFRRARAHQKDAYTHSHATQLLNNTK